jgi:hypothetical protein
VDWTASLVTGARTVVDKTGAVADNNSSGHSIHEDSGRFGRASEHLVASSCILASDLQLNVSISFVGRGR